MSRLRHSGLMWLGFDHSDGVQIVHEPQLEAQGIPDVSVIMPVYNERTTVAEIIRRVRGERVAQMVDIVVVDDASSDGTKRCSGTGGLVGPGGDPSAQPGQGRGHSDRPDLRPWRPRPHPGRRPRVRPGRLAPAARADHQGQGPVVYGSRFTGERKNMLFLHWVGNRFLSLLTNVLYSSTLSDMETCYKVFDRRGARGHDPRSPTASASSPRSRPRSCGGASGSTRCRSPTPVASATRARRSPGATVSRP